MVRETIFEKGRRLARAKMVRKVDAVSYTVRGDHGDYLTTVSRGGKFACTCEYDNTAMCSHVVGLLEMENDDELVKAVARAVEERRTHGPDHE
jgi:uncharacterized Zn finger protein